MRENHYSKDPPGERAKWYVDVGVQVSICARLLAVAFGLLQNIRPHWHLLLSSSNKEVLDLM